MTEGKNGGPTGPPSNVVDLKGDAVRVPEVNDNTLRRMNHVEWLAQFAQVLQMQPRNRDAAVPMSPFRAGAIGRLVLASRYIGLLVKELHWLSRDNRALRAQVKHLGGIVPAPYLPEAEEAHVELQQAAKEQDNDG